MDDEVEVAVSFPLDADGFFRRECPHCVQEFKWRHGPANEDAEQYAQPPAYHCPLCGEPAGHDSWYTQTQLDLMEQSVATQAIDVFQQELEGIFRGKKGVTFKPGSTRAPSQLPDPLTEPDDMTIVTSPCHGYEPVKVPETANGPFYCLVCGAAFAA
ncbi:hypothetical protein PZ938_00060 [Luteipulveratus sp. YIM 133132]|uniref:hypothetical protein n=1 Tax=Luteipulveratus flavus TaxID=3031728 RepID=UPI0023AF6A59|nr:hypothetical protein [Luteipulveratus sp. YIM 133132]MDE9363987.1 hypothetical protein [Luteipulveratus sp. YIM 133132]